MLCPACRNLIHERVPLCPHCGFDFPGAERWFGLPPRLQPGLTDLAGVLSARDQRLVNEELRRLENRFPQLDFAVIVSRVPPQVPLRTCTFWLFNQPDLNSPMHKGGGCRLVLLTLDVDHGRAACMVGYGLEPFVGEEPLLRIVEAAHPSLAGRDYIRAIIAGLDQADAELTEISRGIPEAFGLHQGGTEDETLPGEVFAY